MHAVLVRISKINIGPSFLRKQESRPFLKTILDFRLRGNDRKIAFPKLNLDKIESI